jgi:hypothetical protein
MQNNLNKWKEESSVEIIGNLSGMKIMKGHMSNTENLVNVTVDRIFVDNSKLTNGFQLGHELDRIIREKYSNEVTETVTSFFNKVEKDTNKISKLIYVFPPFTYSHLQRNGLQVNGSTTEKINFTINFIQNIFDGVTPAHERDIELSKSFPIEYINWSETFEGLSNIQILELLIHANREEQFTLPTDGRGKDLRDKIQKGEVDFDSFSSIPVIKLMSILKPKLHVAGWDLKELNEDNFNTTISGLYNLYVCETSLSRIPISSFIQRFKNIVEALLLNLCGGNYLYYPYDYAFKNKIKEHIYINEKNGLIKKIHQMVDKNIITNPQKIHFARGIHISSNIREVEEIPEELSIEISKAITEKRKGLNYETAAGFPNHVVLKIFLELESDESWTSREDYKQFNTTFVSRRNSYMAINHDKKKMSGTFQWAFGDVSKAIIESCATFVATKPSRHTTVALNSFLEWTIKNEIKAADLSEFTPTMFHDPMLRKDIKISFFEFVTKNYENLHSRNTCWREVRNLFSKWASDATYATGTTVVSPMPDTTNMFGHSVKPGVTTRESMPSKLHEICLNVLVENDYAIVQEAIPSTTMNIKNQITGKVELNAKINTLGYLLHLLLLLPLRGYQGRWLCEGLLDDKIWDVSKTKYVKNNHPLANFIYPNGKTHVENFGRTGVIRSDKFLGNDSLSLYISTNKTRSAKTITKTGRMGYEFALPYKSEIESINQIWDVLELQRKQNKKYSPIMTLPSSVLDDTDTVYTAEIRPKLPFFTPLFRSYEYSASKEDPYNRRGLLMPVSSNLLLKLFRAVLKKAEIIYKERNPQFKDQNIAFDEDDEPIYDIHALRVFGITDLLESGMSAEVVQMIVGHQTIIMTRYYHKLEHQDYLRNLKEVKKKSGASIENEVAQLTFDPNSAEELIELFDLVSEWKGETANIQSIKPDFSKSGRDKIINGGVCSGFDCKTGGIDIAYEKNGKALKVTAVQGGNYRCGNCRYWRSSIRFLDEQIYHINVVAMEVNELVNKRINFIKKANEMYDSDIEHASLLGERYERQADESTAILAHRVVDMKRRELMIDACLAKVDSKNTTTTNLPVKIGANTKPKWETLGLFNACMEISTQAVVLQMPESDSVVSVSKLNDFINKMTSIAGVNNPFLFMPDDRTKTLAMLYKLADTAEMLGRSFTDEEFNNPLLLAEIMEEEVFKKLGNMLSTDDHTKILG